MCGVYGEYCVCMCGVWCVWCVWHAFVVPVFNHCFWTMLLRFDVLGVVCELGVFIVALWCGEVAALVGLTLLTIWAGVHALDLAV